MKKLVVAGLLMGMGLTAFGQGVVVMNTAVANACDLAVTLGIPGVTDGTRASASVAGLSTLKVALYGGTSAGSLSLQGTLANFVTGQTGAGGLISAASGGGNRTLAGVNNTTAFVQLRAWTGGYATYEDAVTAANGGATVYGGVNTVKQMTLGDYVNGQPIPAPAQIQWAPGTSTTVPANWTRWNITTVPEPSTLALGALGLIGAFVIRRRK